MSPLTRSEARMSASSEVTKTATAVPWPSTARSNASVLLLMADETVSGAVQTPVAPEASGDRSAERRAGGVPGGPGSVQAVVTPPLGCATTRGVAVGAATGSLVETDSQQALTLPLE